MLIVRVRGQISFLHHIQPRLSIRNESLLPRFTNRTAWTVDLAAFIFQNCFHQLPSELKTKLKALNRSIQIHIIRIRIFFKRSLQPPQYPVIVSPFQMNPLYCHNTFPLVNAKKKSPLCINPFS